jgi:hypothetical protein
MLEAILALLFAAGKFENVSFHRTTTVDGTSCYLIAANNPTPGPVVKAGRITIQTYLVNSKSDELGYVAVGPGGVRFFSGK